MGFKYETHVHTSEVSACATSTAAEQVHRYKQLGYTGIIVTDHFTNGNSVCPYNAPWDVKMRQFISGYLSAKKAGDKCGLDVFLGWEYTIRGADFLTYGPDAEFLFAHPNLDMLELEEYSDLVRSSGGYLAQAHPYRTAFYIERGEPEDPRLIDGVEVYNVQDTDAANRQALAFAEKHCLPIQAGSDCHSVRWKHYSGIVLDERARDIFDIIDAIKGRRVRVI